MKTNQALNTSQVNNAPGSLEKLRQHYFQIMKARAEFFEQKEEEVLTFFNKTTKHYSSHKLR